MMHLAACALSEKEDSMRLVFVYGGENPMSQRRDVVHPGSDLCTSQEEILGFSCVVSVLPLEGHACIAKDELHQIGEAGFCPHIVRENDDAPLTLLKTHDRVCSLLVVATFEEAMTLRPVKDDHAKARVKIFALL